MLIVQKFGGTSVGSIERMKTVARILIDAQRAGHRVVGVVSAMSGETNRLVDLATQINPQPWSREYDMLLASGEQVSAALVSLAINAMGAKARPLLGHQIGILTDQVYSKARIQEINTSLLRKELDAGVIPIVAGFQGVDCDNNITTLGRGGSDTSAVALAAALKADRCDIFTDVDGVYTTDPRICSKARKIEKITYDEMMELASLGAKVLQIRSVELGAKYKVPIRVCSSFDTTKTGTLVTSEDKTMENVVVSGVAAVSNDAKVSVMNLPDRAGLAYDIFGALAEAAIVVDVIVQNSSAEGRCSLSFTVPKDELDGAIGIVKKQFEHKHPEMELSTQTDLAKVSVVGQGMRNHPGVAAKMFKVLADAGIDIKLITTSEIKISVLVHQDRMKEAVEKLHSAFNLDAI